MTVNSLRQTLQLLGESKELENTALQVGKTKAEEHINITDKVPQRQTNIHKCLKIS